MSRPAARVVARTMRRVVEGFALSGASPPPARKTIDVIKEVRSETVSKTRFDKTRVFKPTPPKADPFEVRRAVILQLTDGIKVSQYMHIFEDGAINSTKQLVEEKNVRVASNERLTAEENWYLHLDQTQVREKAYGDMLEELEHLRKAESLPLDAKEACKANALRHYEERLKQQKMARRVAAAELYGK